MKMNQRFFFVACVLSLVAFGAYGAGPVSQVWLTLQPDADLLGVKAAVEQTGGSVLTLAPEGRLLVQVPANAAAQLRGIAGVVATEVVAAPSVPAPTVTAPNPKRLGVRPPTPEERAYVDRVRTKVKTVAPNALSRQRALLSGASTLPSTVDNSLSQYFPPIGNQGNQGSCSCFATCYYYSTYTQANDEGLNASSGNTDYICSPAFMYPLVNDGGDTGAWPDQVMVRLDDVGCSNWTLKPYSEDDYWTWPTEAAWVDALQRRTLAAHVIGTADSGCTDDDLVAVKQHLANGEVAATETQVYDNWYSYYPSNTDGVNNGVLFANSGYYDGLHALTIVGYDDTRPYYDGSTTQHGAFLIANSWGAWGVTNTGGSTVGFMWVAYSFFESTPNCFGIAFYNDDRPRYRPQMYAVAGLNHAERGLIKYTGGIGPSTAPLWRSYAPIDHAGGTDLSINDTKRVAVDLTDGMPLITNPANIQLFVAMSVDSETSAGSISSADFTENIDNNGTFVTHHSSDPPVTVSSGTTNYATVTFAKDPLGVMPADGMSVSGPMSGPFTPSTQDFTLTNIGAISIPWTASKSASWLDLSATSGTLKANDAIILTAAVNTNAGALPVGTYTDTITVTNATSGISQKRSVALAVTEPVSITPSESMTVTGPMSGPFTPVSMDYTLANPSSGSVTWIASKDADWLDLSVTGGTVNSAGSVIVTATINANANALSLGAYAGSITFTDATTGVVQTRTVSLTVVEPLAITPADGLISSGKMNGPFLPASID